MHIGLFLPASGKSCDRGEDNDGLITLASPADSPSCSPLGITFNGSDSFGRDSAPFHVIVFLERYL